MKITYFEVVDNTIKLFYTMDSNNSFTHIVPYSIDFHEKLEEAFGWLNNAQM